MGRQLASDNLVSAETIDLFFLYMALRSLLLP
jgi:hypothetical protein